MADPVVVDTQHAQPETPAWWLTRLNARLLARRARMDLFDAYYRGEHRNTFKVRQVLDAFGLRDQLNVNYCGIVVESLLERLGIDGFRFGAPTASDADAASQAAWTIWQGNGLESRFKRGWRSGLVKSEFALMVWPDKAGEPQIFVGDGAEIVVAYDPADPRTPLAALKRWRDEDRRQTFATLYLPGATYKYEQPAGAGNLPTSTADLTTVPEGFNSGGGAGVKITGPASSTAAAAETWHVRKVDGEDWPLPNPFGQVPVFAIPTRPDLRGVGQSVLTAVVPIQDAINANVANAMLAGLYGAFRQKWAINVNLEVDEATGKPKVPWDVAVDKIMTAPPPEAGEPAAAFGEFSQSELKGYIELHDTFVLAIATTSRIPINYLLQQGSFPSGEALTAAERGLSEAAREIGVDASMPVLDAMRFAMRVKATRAQVSTAEKARLLKWAATPNAEVRRRDPETRSESQHVDALVKLLALKLPLQEIWSRLPATPQQVQEWTQAMQTLASATEPSGSGSTDASTPAAGDGNGNGSTPPALETAVAGALADATSGATVGSPPADASA